MVASFQKCERASQAMDEIASQHSLEEIERNITTYARTKEANSKTFYQLLKRCQCNKKVVDQHTPQCDDCQRRQLLSDFSATRFYALSFHTKDWSCAKRRTLKHTK